MVGGNEVQKPAVLTQVRPGPFPADSDARLFSMHFPHRYENGFVKSGHMFSSLLVTYVPFRFYELPAVKWKKTKVAHTARVPGSYLQLHWTYIQEYCYMPGRERKRHFKHLHRTFLEPTVNPAPTRAVRQPEPVAVLHFHLPIPTPMRSKARGAMRMIVTCARTTAGLGRRELNSEAVRERVRRRWNGRMGLDRGTRIHSERSQQLCRQKRNKNAPPIHDPRRRFASGTGTPA